MIIGDHVFYDNRRAKIIEEKWGLFCILFYDNKKSKWVHPKLLHRVVY